MHLDVVFETLFGGPILSYFTTSGRAASHWAELWSETEGEAWFLGDVGERREELGHWGKVEKGVVLECHRLGLCVVLVGEFGSFVSRVRVRSSPVQGPKSRLVHHAPLCGLPVSCGPDAPLPSSETSVSAFNAPAPACCAHKRRLEKCDQCTEVCT